MKKRPDVLTGATYKIRSACGNIYFTVNRNEAGEIMETHLVLGKCGSCVRNLLELVALQWSVLLQSGIDCADIIKFLKRYCCGVRCENSFYYGGAEYKSCIDFCASTLVKELENAKR